MPLSCVYTFHILSSDYSTAILVKFCECLINYSLSGRVQTPSSCEKKLIHCNLATLVLINGIEKRLILTLAQNQALFLHSICEFTEIDLFIAVVAINDFEGSL